MTWQWLDYDFVDSLTSLFALSTEEIQPPTEATHLFLSHISCMTAKIRGENLALIKICIVSYTLG